MNDSEYLIGLSFGELEALADGVLMPAAQSRLSELLAMQRRSSLNATHVDELDRLLERIDHLNLLKARARLTLATVTAKSP